MFLVSASGHLFLAACFFTLAKKRPSETQGDFEDCSGSYLQKIGVVCFCPRDAPNARKACLNVDFAYQRCGEGSSSTSTARPTTPPITTATAETTTTTEVRFLRQFELFFTAAEIISLKAARSRSSIIVCCQLYRPRPTNSLLMPKN